MPNSFQSEWKTVKDDFIKRARDVPPELVMDLSLGNDFGPALKAFDSATGYETRMKAMPKVMRAKIAYEKQILAALKTTESRVGKAGLSALVANIDRIFQEVELAAQPPRPSSQMVSAYTLRGFDLAAGVKTLFLKVDPIPITVEVECDKVFKELIDSGQAGLRAQELGDAAVAELSGMRDAFRKTIMAVDDKIRADPTILAAKSKEANEVLQYYGKLVQDRIDVAVQAAWKSYLQRKTDLSDFRIKCATKIILGTIGVAVAAASVVLTFGAAWMNIVAACKGIVDVAKSIKTWAEEIDTVWAQLTRDIESVDKLNAERDKAKKDGKGQKASKGKQIGKEVIAGVLPFTKDMVKALSAIEARAKQFNGLVGKLEGKANDMSGRIELITRNLNKSPDRLLSTEQINLERRMGKTVSQMMNAIAELHQTTKAGAKFANEALASVKELKSKDTWTGKIEAGGGVGSKGVAIYGAANFCLACADKGKQLIALLPV